MFLLGRLDSLILTGFCFLWMGCLGVGGRLVDSVAIPASEVPSFEQVLMRVTRIKRKNIPLIVYLDGTYTIESKRDLGKEYSDITFRPAPNAKHPVLTGMHKITNWDQIDGIWKTQLPKFVNSFFVDGRRLPKAKMPLVGNYTVEGQYSLEDNSKFCYKGQDINPNWIGAEIVTVQAWAESRMTIKEVDPTMRTVVLSGKMKPYNIISNPPYWVENLVEGLEVPGTWAIDKNNILSYRPRLGEEPLKTECSVPLTEQFFNIHNLSNLSFEKINFIGSDWLLPPTGYANLQADADLCGTIQMEYVNHCSFIECEFAHLGSHAIWCDNGCNQNVFRNNSMEDLGGGGIVVGYNNKLPGIHDISTNNIITNNQIHNIGNIHFGACGITLLYSSGNLVTNNFIHDTFYTGISVGWEWDNEPSLIKDNLVCGNILTYIEKNRFASRPGTLLSDMGGIYTLGSQPGTMLTDNVIDGTYSALPSQAPGIYLDQGSDGILVTGNCLSRIDGLQYWQHMAGNNIVMPNEKCGEMVFTRKVGSSLTHLLVK